MYIFLYFPPKFKIWIGGKSSENFTSVLALFFEVRARVTLILMFHELSSLVLICFLIEVEKEQHQQY